MVGIKKKKLGKSKCCFNVDVLVVLVVVGDGGEEYCEIV